MERLEKEYPILKEGRQHQEIKAKNRWDLVDFIGKGIWLLLKIFI